MSYAGNHINEHYSARAVYMNRRGILKSRWKQCALFSVRLLRHIHEKGYSSTMWASSAEFWQSYALELEQETEMPVDLIAKHQSQNELSKS